MTAIKDQWESPDGSVRLLLGDCLEILPTLEAGSVDCVVTDPPYGMNCNTDWARFTAGTRGHRNENTGAGMGRTYDMPVTGDEHSFDPSPWLTFQRVVLWGANHYGQHLPVGTTLVWIKRLDDAFGSFLSDAEVAWMKGGHGVYCHRDLTNNSKPQHRKHPTQKPIGLMRWCLDKSTVPAGETVFDPYMGVATTGVACIRTERRFIGIEIERKYFDIAVERCKRELERFPLFEKTKPKQLELI